MRRLRLLRVLFPIALVVVVAALVVAFRDRPQAHRVSASGTGHIQQRVTGLKAVSVTPEGRTLAFEVDQVQELEEGKYRLEDIERLEVFREGLEPLVVTARLGDVEGEPGQRVMRFRGGVTEARPSRRFRCREGHAGCCPA